MKKKIKVKVKVKKDCTNCDHCLYVGEGDHVCDLEIYAGAVVEPLTDDFQMTDHYFYCGGSKWIEVS